MTAFSRKQSLDNFKRFKELTRRASNSEPLGDLAPYLAMAGHDYLNNKYKTLEECFGLSNGRGRSTVFTEQALTDRNMAIIEIAKKFYPGESVSAQARAIRREFNLYEAGKWRFDRNKESMPVEYRNTIKSYLYLALNSCSKIPEEKQLRRILSVGH